jgi:hypothetical protein
MTCFAYRLSTILVTGTSIPRGLAVAMMLCPICSVAATEAPNGEHRAGGVPRFRVESNDATCADRAHERVRALMHGVPWHPTNGRPAAKNRDCT